MLRPLRLHADLGPQPQKPATKWPLVDSKNKEHNSCGIVVGNIGATTYAAAEEGGANKNLKDFTAQIVSFECAV